MTKKAFIRENSKSDFLVADPKAEGFFSLETGRHYNEALVVYTGVELSKEMIVEKARKNGQKVSDEAAMYTIEMSQSTKSVTLSNIKETIKAIIYL